MTWHEFLIIETSQNKHRGMKWLKYITIHLGINIRLQYIRDMDEYIPKLQLHQHSLLTRKVFSWHNLSAQVFFSVSSRSSSGIHHLQIHLHLQVIFIYKSSSSISHLYWIWIIMEHHHWIWIITRSGSSWNIITRSGWSLDLDHHGTSSLDLDHLSIWIISVGSSSLDLDPHSIWIITGYHHWISIITRSGSSLVMSHDSSCHRKFYRAIPFSCWL